MNTDPLIRINLELTYREFDALAQLADEKQLSVNGVIRQALRSYQLAYFEEIEGKSLSFVKLD